MNCVDLQAREAKKEAEGSSDACHDAGKVVQKDLVLLLDEPLLVEEPQLKPKNDLVTDKCVGSGCGTVDRAVASNTRCVRFESSHRQNLYLIFVYLLTINCIEKTEINKKRGWEWPI